MANVFVSHRGADAEPARLLAEEIRAAGHEVWLDEWKIDIGDSIVGRIDEGLSQASHVVLCYSSAAGAPAWMNIEWHSTLARQLDNHGVKLLPVRLTGGEPPAILADIKYADLLTDWKSGLNALLRSIR
jgi:hypothetical protein